MSDMQLSHFLKPGTKLTTVVTAPCPREGSAFYKIGKADHEAKDITVIEECGQMGMVPWARVETNSGVILLVNLAAAESVTLMVDVSA